MTHRIPLIIISSAATVILFAAMSALTDFPLLDTMWHASAEEIHRAVSSLTAAQIRAYYTMLVVDFCYAIAYTILLILLFRSFRSNRGFCRVLRRAGMVATATAGLSDYLENGLILTVLSALPAESRGAAVLGPVTTLKWLAVITAVALLAVMSVGQVLRAAAASRKQRLPHG